jgi:hypothetical protein
MSGPCRPMIRPISRVVFIEHLVSSLLRSAWTSVLLSMLHPAFILSCLAPMLTFLSCDCIEVVYTYLLHAQLLLTRNPHMWRKDYRSFYSRYHPYCAQCGAVLMACAPAWLVSPMWGCTNGLCSCMVSIPHVGLY